MVLAPALDTHQAWFNYRAWAGTFASGRVDSFNWTQTYGPLRWPRLDRAVLQVRAKTGDYWKAENLETFDGIAWIGTCQPNEPNLPSPTRASLERWTQQMKVTVRGMKTVDVIGAGTTTNPVDVPGTAQQGASPGTWIAGQVLGPGDSYRVTAYSPHPSTTQLQTAGSAYPVVALASYLTIGLPGRQFAVGPATQVNFPFFHPGPAVQSLGSTKYVTRAVESSAYAGAYALARRLSLTRARRSSSSRASRAIWLTASPTTSAHRSAATRSRASCSRTGAATASSSRARWRCCCAWAACPRASPPASPAAATTARPRVGRQRPRRACLGGGLVPRYGWVRFDPTPAVAPARSGTVTAPQLSGDVPGGSSLGTVNQHTAATSRVVSSAKHSSGSRRGGGGFPLLPAIAAIAAIALLSLLVRLARALLAASEPSGDELVLELERALARCGRPLAGGVTLAALERRFRSSPGAAAYIREVRLSRFAGRPEPPSESGRRALRATLGNGLGPVGRLRALWALPPRIKRS